MLLFKKVTDLQQHLAAVRGNSQTIGFVPTMGALHEGHLDLIRHSKSDGHPVTVCSIFVNPTQFNDPKDLEKYPRPIERDIELLSAAGCEVLFLPEVEEIYPPDWVSPTFEFGALATVMEGAMRPGHFAGVAQVVHRLLSIVQPDSLYLGQKDYQQVAIIKELVFHRLQWDNLRVVTVPTVREPDGLAMSSRNIRLTAQGRAQAPTIARVLREAVEFSRRATLAETAAFIRTSYAQAQLEVDYVELVDAYTLQPVARWEDASDVVACVVVRIDGVRLLDNAFMR